MPAVGMLSGAIGNGVALVSEYRKHGQQQKQAQVTPLERSQEPSPANLHGDFLPSYEDTAGQEVITSFPADTKEPAQYEGDTDSDNESSLEYDSDNEAWALDEVVTHSDSDEPPSYKTVTAESRREATNELVQDIMVSSTLHATSPCGTPRRPLPCPVILPQRRPHKKARGFVRAYAPVLADTGVDQETFLKFLKTFHKSSQASPIFDVIAISAGIAGFAPSVIAMVVCAAVEVGARVGVEIQARYRTNNFLDRVNETLFKPAGLFAMIVRYKASEDTDSTSISAQSVNLSTHRAIAKHTRQCPTKSAGESSRSMSNRVNDLRLASDTTRGAMQMPEAAPLIYPELDRKIAKEGPETFRDRSSDAQKFLASYMDRRAQMPFATQAPPSSLTVPQGDHQPPAGLKDTDHPMYSGGLAALITGGAFNPRGMVQERRDLRQSAKDMRRLARGKRPRHGYVAESVTVQGRESSSARALAGPSNGTYVHVGRKAPRETMTLGKIAKKVFQEDVLYLMIVNMPSDAELAEARAELARTN